MKSDKEAADIIDRTLSGINRTGEEIGATLKGIFGGVKRISLIVLLVLGAGLAVFIWSIVKGMGDRKE